jgi:uncharacterized membrane protein YccC
VRDQQQNRSAVLLEFGFLWDKMADEIVRLRRILDALREPSEAVVQAVFLTVFEDEPAFEDQCRKAAADAIRAAVAAAEQEASDDAR